VSTAHELLAAHRRTTLARIHDLAADLDGIVSSSDANIDDEHDPEGATLAFERAQVAALLSSSQAYLDDLDRALSRVDDGTYGLCDGCGAHIAPERLAARPAVRTCIGCAPGPTRRG